MKLEAVIPIGKRTPRETVLFLRDVRARRCLLTGRALKECLKANYVETTKAREHLCGFDDVLTPLGKSVSMIRLLPRIPGPAALQRIEAVRERAVATNTWKNWPFTVKRVVLFGSALHADSNTTHGDIDLEVEVERVYADHEVQQKAVHFWCNVLAPDRRWCIGGRSRYIHDTTIRKVKGRDRYVHLAYCHDLDCEKKVIFGEPL